MPVTPFDTLEVAKHLQKQKIVPIGESCDRATIGRAYYAAFHAVQDTVRSAYNRARFQPTHAALVRGLKNTSDPAIADIGERLETLRNKREHADYRVELPIQPLDARLMLASAQHIVATIPGLVAQIPPGIG